MLCDAQYATEYVQLALWLDISNIQQADESNIQ